MKVGFKLREVLTRPSLLDVHLTKMNLLVLTAFGPAGIGFLISEGYPYSYPRNADNTTTYPIPDGWLMNIYFKDFDVEESPLCK